VFGVGQVEGWRSDTTRERFQGCRGHQPFHRATSDGGTQGNLKGMEGKDLRTPLNIQKRGISFGGGERESQHSWRGILGRGGSNRRPVPIQCDRVNMGVRGGCKKGEPLTCIFAQSTETEGAPRAVMKKGGDNLRTKSASSLMSVKGKHQKEKLDGGGGRGCQFGLVP